jgi:hypothetical protein
MGVYKKTTSKHNVGDSKKPFRLNLNIYRNTQSFALNTAKKNFKEMITELDIEEVYLDKVYVIYKLYNGNKRLSDLLNWVSVIDKFFMDALVELSIIPEDNYTVVPVVLSLYGGYDKDKERMEVTLTDSVDDVINELVKYKEKNEQNN